ncbi:peptidase [Chryseobacterium sp. BIGb0232]|uniref:peptidase n=1 Tax=Chryseobacterium sp. BIGb0232 TaxID=2940598 RepID=UPI000F473BDE|nr:peptidase [Chryseobacterium sp. BIGb0232]MCS4305110.1 ribonuclease Z [Chryseobacterium sp. BIGb0232]ROS07738.1 ribonuclease Z [Chryseobacterium nakagawai]
MLQAEIKSLLKEDISILVKVPNSGKYYLCDCGEASLLTVKEAQTTSAIFISHTHIDHFANFDGIFRHQIGSGEKVIICGPQNIHEQIGARLKSYTWNLIDENAIEYQIHEIVSKEEIKIYTIRPPYWNLEYIKTQNFLFEDEYVHVDFAILDHKTDSIAYLFKEKDSVTFHENVSDFKKGKWISELKTAFENNDPDKEIEIEGTLYKALGLFHLLTRNKGYKLGVIMDHAADEDNYKKIKEVFNNTDMVYIETFYKDEDQEFAKMNHHSFASASGKIMKECNVKEAIPIHFSRRYTENDQQEIETAFYKAFRN